MLKERLEEYRADAGQVKDEQARLIDNLRQQLNVAMEQGAQGKEERLKEFKKLKQRYEDQRRRETDQYGFELEKLRTEIALT